LFTSESPRSPDSAVARLDTALARRNDPQAVTRSMGSFYSYRIASRRKGEKHLFIARGASESPLRHTAAREYG